MDLDKYVNNNTLDLNGPFTFGDIQDVVSCLKENQHITHLNLTNNYFISGEDIKALAASENLRNLEQLNLANNRISG